MAGIGEIIANPNVLSSLTNLFFLTQQHNKEEKQRQMEQEHSKQKLELERKHIEQQQKRTAAMNRLSDSLQTSSKPLTREERNFLQADIKDEKQAQKDYQDQAEYYDKHEEPEKASTMEAIKDQEAGHQAAEEEMLQGKEPMQQVSNYLKGYGHESAEDVSVGCVPCTLAHLSTVSTSLEENNPVAAQEEMIALLEYDLTPEKIAKTPEKDRAVLAKYREQIERLSQDLTPNVPRMASASASLKEARRFALEGDLNHPEARERIRRAKDAINYVERVEFSPERMADLSPDQREQMYDNLKQLRSTRQDLLNHTHTLEELNSVSARVAKINYRLNDIKDSDKIKEVAARAAALNTSFEDDVLDSWSQKGA